MQSAIFITFIALLFAGTSCEWIAQQKEIDHQLELVGVEAAKEEIEVSKKLAEKEIVK